MDDADFLALGLVAPLHRKSPPVGPPDVASILDRQLAIDPEVEAVVDARRRLSYGMLDRAIDVAARLFMASGVQAGDRVAASIPNVCDIVVAFMAAQRLGAVWVGVNAVLSPAEKRHILAHSGAKLLLTDARGAPVFENLRGDLPKLAAVLVIDGPQDGGWSGVFDPGERAHRPAAQTDPFAPAAIMYTSGTTGAPKGVVHSQHNMVVVCASISEVGSLEPKGRRGMVLPLTITNVMILGPLIAFWNGRACVCGGSAKADPLIDWLQAEKVNTFSGVPTMVYDLLQTPRDLPAHARLAAGGAPLPMSIRKSFKDRYRYPLGGSYGLTEAPTVVAETRDLEPPVGSSGLVLPHLEVTIRGSGGDAVPTGTIGEVCVSAVTTGQWANVYTPALGYWLEPEKTAALLRGGVLHTNDMGRLDEDGWLYLADRSSELILRGGSNIYPAEVERVLHDHEGVAACALVGRPDARLGMRTVAFVQAARGDADEGELREALTALCQASLARYKTPDEWIFVDEFPRNAMGKILKPALRARFAAPQDAGGAHLA